MKKPKPKKPLFRFSFLFKFFLITALIVGVVIVSGYIYTQQRLIGFSKRENENSLKLIKTQNTNVYKEQNSQGGKKICSDKISKDRKVDLHDEGDFFSVIVSYPKSSFDKNSFVVKDYLVSIFDESCFLIKEITYDEQKLAPANALMSVNIAENVLFLNFHVGPRGSIIQRITIEPYSEDIFQAIFDQNGKPTFNFFVSEEKMQSDIEKSRLNGF